MSRRRFNISKGKVLFFEDLCSLTLEHLYAGTELCWVSRNRSGKDSASVELWEQ